ncbi:MAG: PPC domain-containing protein [Myxococcota bacterium]|nr:PPC domain-containing protein [Myxococcota bacterium]
MRRSLRCSLLLTALLAGACGGDTVAPDAGTPEDGGGTDANRPDTGVDGGPPPNDTFATATEIALGDDPIADEINPRSDVDFFTFEGTAGQWVAITTASDDTVTERVDTVITLYDASMTQIAENDDAQPRADVDSEIVIKLPATGTYYVEVQEFSTWAPDMVDDGPQGGPTYDYELSVFELTDAAPRVTVDPETGDDAASATMADVAMNVGFLLGDFDSPTDVDVFRFTSGGRPEMSQLMQVHVMPAGPDGYGATRSAARVWVTDADGTTILARGTITEDGRSIQPALMVAGPHLLWIEAPGGTAGANDHYVVKIFFGTDNPLETVAPNETLETATPLVLSPIEGGMGENGFVLAQLAEGDVDYFGFDVMAGRTVSIACGSRTAGSGVLDLTAELRAMDDSVLTMDVETATENVFIDSFVVPAAGRYYLRLSSSGVDPEVTGTWVRCGVTAAPPAP